MESRGLARIVHQLQDEIRKLKTENRTLRGQIGPQIRSTEPAAEVTEGGDAGEQNQSHLNLRRNASVPALEGQYTENIIMTVRRYSISSSAIHVHRKSSGTHKAPSDSWSRPLGEEQGLSRGPAGDRDKPTTRRLLQQRLKSRPREKTVTFLLPVDDIYTDRPVSDGRPSDTER